MATFSVSYIASRIIKSAFPTEVCNISASSSPAMIAPIISPAHCSLRLQLFSKIEYNDCFSRSCLSIAAKETALVDGEALAVVTS